MRRIVLALILVVGAAVAAGGGPASADHSCPDLPVCPTHDLPPPCQQTAAKPCLPPPCPAPYENQAYDICLPVDPCLGRTDCCPPQSFWCPEPETETASPCYPDEPCDPPPPPLPCYEIGKLCIPVPPCPESAAAAICVPEPCDLMDNCPLDPCTWMTDCCPPSFVCWNEGSRPAGGAAPTATPPPRWILGLSDTA